VKPLHGWKIGWTDRVLREDANALSAQGREESVTQTARGEQASDSMALSDEFSDLIYCHAMWYVGTTFKLFPGRLGQNRATGSRAAPPPERN
jgi:hypothetical protein